MRRYACVWFPDWPIDRLRRARRGRDISCLSGKPDDPPFILTEQGVTGLRVAAANVAANRLGIGPGLRFADAKSRAPHLQAEPIDRGADAAALEALGLWATRWTPLSAMDGMDGLRLDITGCGRFFGGEGALLNEIGERFAHDGFSCRIGAGPTPGAAWALAHHGEDRVNVCRADERVEDALKDLPVQGLRLSEAAERLLRRFGLTRIGQLYDIDRTALTRRFASREAADAVRLRLDQALGLMSEPLTPLRPPPDYVARQSFVDPLISGEGIVAGLASLSEQLCRQLEKDGKGARDFTLTAFRSNGTASLVSLSTARPVRDPAHIRRLFRDRIETIDPGFGIDLLVFSAARPDHLEIEARHLSADLAPGPVDREALSALADRLTARLGEGAVRLARPVDSHDPVRAEGGVAFEGQEESWEVSLYAPRGDRPVRLFDRPEAVDVLAEVPDGPPIRFVWRRVARRVMRADGPERIAPEWWRTFNAEARARDYYRIEDEEGRRYWVFRDGLYQDGRGGPPRWFVQGLLA
ncbi:DNA polymerase Y family protein [Hyphobacterium sp. HN65]|uniref:DNA-directed DNA polymerase n=1 Tax=Hyphobacterium lacteum TaxID=3116575 RepID=A0ABU7LPC4_9PROT|nr:DNA polymerase Y family protein [Hyphobacterium sp. HN65]MEE2525770.1 DNA polymerase Y family protein [Hyphobacterium sp. HN65]